MKLHYIFHRFMRPDDNGSTGAGMDYGDDFTPTDDDASPAKPEVKPEAKPEPKADDNADEDEGEGEGEGEGDKEEKPAKTKGAPRIPLARHQEMLNKARAENAALAAELAAARASSTQAAAAQQASADVVKLEEAVVKLEREYIKLLADGNADAATAKMAEIRRTEREIGQVQTQLATQAAEARAYERVRYDTTVERLEAAFPLMNPDHEDFDKEKTAEIVELRDAYLASGRYSRPDALQKAVRTLLGTETKKQEAATEVDVRVSKDAVAEQVRADRKAAQVKKNVENADKLPGNLNAAGKDSDRLGGKLNPKDVIKMSQKEFAALSDAELSEMRGDNF